MYKKVFLKDIRLFWMVDDATYPISDLVAISEISTEFRNGKSFVTFIVSSAAKNFIINFQRGTIAVRYDVVPEDSPFAGESFLTIADMKPSRNYIHPLTSWDAKKNDEVVFELSVNCMVSWGYLKKEIDEHNEWQERELKNEDDS